MKMTLTNADILGLLRAHGELASRGAVFAPAVRMALARNLRELQAIGTDIDRVRGQLIEQHVAPTDYERGPDMQITIRPDAMAVFAPILRDLMLSRTEVDLRPVSEADLDLDVNDIPVSVLTALLPLLDAAPLAAAA